MSHTAPGRRSATTRRTRVNLTTVLAVTLPVLTALALFAVRPGDADEPTSAPTRTDLTTATIVCPAPMTDAPDVVLTSAADGVDGDVRVGLGDKTTKARVTSGKVTTVGRGDGPAAVIGEDGTAPGLTAARFGSRETAAAGCVAPAPVAWFTGLGAGAGHTSVIELVNPDSGTAVADITVYGNSGVVDVPQLRGVSVPGGSSVELDLASIVPRRDELAIQVVASRGRLGSTVLDRYDEVGAAKLTQDWLPAEAAPVTSNTLMGLAPGQGRRTLVVANPGDSEVRADLQFVTEESVFAPQGVPEIRIPPRSVQRISVSSELGPAIQDGATGVRLTSSGPITATLRSYVEGDLSHAVQADVVETSATVLLPEGAKGDEKSLLLAGASAAGDVTVRSWNASGAEYATAKVEISPNRGVTVKLHSGAVLVTITPARTVVTGSAMVSGTSGAAVLPLRQPVLSGLIPAVRPGLP
jgi:hypothetical protein